MDSLFLLFFSVIRVIKQFISLICKILYVCGYGWRNTRENCEENALPLCEKILYCVLLINESTFAFSHPEETL